MKKKTRIAIIASSLAAVMVVGGSLAYFTDADTVTNTFTVGKVTIDLTEPNFDEENTTKDLVPNQEVQKDPQITNTGINDAYMFMEVEVPFAEIVRVDQDGSTFDKYPTELFGYTVNDGWTEITYANGRTTDNIEGKTSDYTVYEDLEYAVQDAAGQNTGLTANSIGPGGNLRKTPVLDSQGNDLAHGYYDYYNYYTITGDAAVANEKYDSLPAAQARVDFAAKGTIVAHEKYTVNGKTFDTLAAAQNEATSAIAQYGEGSNESKILHIGKVRHLYAYTGSNAVQTETDDTVMQKVAKDQKTAPLFNAVRLVNLVEDLGIEGTTQEIVINAYAIQADFINNADASIDGATTAGKTKAGDVWAVVNKQSNSSVVADYQMGRDKEDAEDESTDIPTP